MRPGFYPALGATTLGVLAIGRILPMKSRFSGERQAVWHRYVQHT